MNLISGGWKSESLGIPAQCVLLESCGCQHWMDPNEPTYINEDHLMKLLDNYNKPFEDDLPCAQLIVGSAPVSEDLLRGYRELGIEVHNAYGLTEAPLVTINRLGANRIGTVGEPLPGTDLKLKKDCEVMVRGLQVTPGYSNDKTRDDFLFEDGWLLTGDYGHLTPEGSLVITGRKKEMIVNSYGKSISPMKIESMLKDLDSVSDVMRDVLKIVDSYQPNITL